MSGLCIETIPVGQLQAVKPAARPSVNEISLLYENCCLSSNVEATHSGHVTRALKSCFTQAFMQKLVVLSFYVLVFKIFVLLAPYVCFHIFS